MSERQKGETKAVDTDTRTLAAAHLAAIRSLAETIEDDASATDYYTASAIIRMSRGIRERVDALAALVPDAEDGERCESFPSRPSTPATAHVQAVKRGTLRPLDDDDSTRPAPDAGRDHAEEHVRFFNMSRSEFSRHMRDAEAVVSDMQAHALNAIDSFAAERDAAVARANALRSAYLSVEADVVEGSFLTSLLRQQLGLTPEMLVEDDSG